MKFSEYLSQLYDYHYWATHRVLAAAEALTKEQLHQPQRNDYSSIHGLLVHLMGAEWIWLQRAQGNSPTAIPSVSEFPTLEALKERWAALEAEMRAFIAAQTDESLGREVHYTTTSGKPFHMALWQMMVHAANHGTHHRGELAEMFARLGVAHEEDDLNQYFLMQSGQR
jgi:uncharacterized damage-inducible protein DinB